MRLAGTALAPDTLGLGNTLPVSSWTWSRGWYIGTWQGLLVLFPVVRTDQITFSFFFFFGGGWREFSHRYLLSDLWLTLMLHLLKCLWDPMRSKRGVSPWMSKQALLFGSRQLTRNTEQMQRESNCYFKLFSEQTIVNKNTKELTLTY